MESNTAPPDPVVVFERLYDQGFYFLAAGADKSPISFGGVPMGVTHAHRDIAKLKLHLEHLAIAGGIVEGTDAFLVVIDVDIKKEDGNASLKELEGIYGPLPDTLTVKSLSGGRHLYYLTPMRIGSCNNAFKTKYGQPGLDIKGHNGYVMCPPTAGYEITKDMAPVMLPISWQLFLRSTVEQREDLEAALDTFSIPPDVAEVTLCNEQIPLRKALELAGYKKVDENTYCHPFGATSPANVSILKNQSFLKHSAPEVSYHWGAHDKVQKGPHDTFDLLRILSHDGDWNATVEAVRRQFPKQTPAGDDDPIDAGGHYFQICDRLTNRPVRKELVYHHFRQGDVVFLSGNSENMKTFWVLDAAFCLATGLPFLESFPVRQDADCKKSLLVLTESGYDYRDRVEAFVRLRSQIHKVNPDDLRKLIDEHVIAYFNPLILNKKESVDRFEKFKKVVMRENFQPIALMVLDHFSNNVDLKDENSNSEVAKFLNILRVKARQDNSVIIVPHHPSKAGALLRGAVAILNNVPVVYLFSRQECTDGVKLPVQITQEKCSYGVAFQPYFLEPHVFDMYADPGSILPEMRTGLALTAANADGDPIPNPLNPGKPKFNPGPPESDEPTPDAVGATLHDKVENDQDDQDDDEKQGRGRPPDLEFQQALLDYLDSIKDNPGGRDRTDVRSIAAILGAHEEKVRRTLMLLLKQEKVKQYALKKDKRFLWGIAIDPDTE